MTTWSSTVTSLFSVPWNISSGRLVSELRLSNVLTCNSVPAGTDTFTTSGTLGGGGVEALAVSNAGDEFTGGATGAAAGCDGANSAGATREYCRGAGRLTCRGVGFDVTCESAESVDP